MREENSDARQKPFYQTLEKCQFFGKDVESSSVYVFKYHMDIT